MFIDGKFEPIWASLAELQTNMNVVSCNKHDLEAKCSICTIKERMSGAYSILPFCSMTRRLIIELVYWAIFWINIFPADSDISTHIIPRAIITVLELDFHKHFKVKFWQYF